MKRITFLLFIFLFISCNQDSDDLNEIKYSKVTYQVDGVGSPLSIQLNNTGLNENSPRVGQTERFENVTFPFTYTIDKFYPHWMEIFVTVKTSDPANYPTKISFIKDGILVKVDDKLVDRSYWNDGTTSYSLSYKWGVLQ